MDLPVPLVVVIHENEGRGKSTGVHAGVLCPKAQVVIFPAERRCVQVGERNCVEPDDGFNAWRRLKLGSAPAEGVPVATAAAPVTGGSSGSVAASHPSAEAPAEPEAQGSTHGASDANGGGGGASDANGGDEGASKHDGAAAGPAGDASADPSAAASACDGTYLLFPGEGSVPLESLPLGTVKRLIVIDSTWLQTKAMLRDTRLKSLPRVSIVAEKTKFWRFQTGT